MRGIKKIVKPYLWVQMFLLQMRITVKTQSRAQRSNINIKRWQKEHRKQSKMQINRTETQIKWSQTQGPLMKMYQLFSQLFQIMYISDKSNDKLKENATVGKSDEGRAK